MNACMNYKKQLLMDNANEFDLYYASLVLY